MLRGGCWHHGEGPEHTHRNTQAIHIYVYMTPGMCHTVIWDAQYGEMGVEYDSANLRNTLYDTSLYNTHTHPPTHPHTHTQDEGPGHTDRSTHTQEYTHRNNRAT